MSKVIRLTRMQLRGLIKEVATGGQALTTGDLQSILQSVDPTTPVFVDNHGEYRAIQRGDVKALAQSRGEITTDDGEFDAYDGPAVVISSWS